MEVAGVPAEEGLEGNVGDVEVLFRDRPADGPIETREIDHNRRADPRDAEGQRRREPEITAQDLHRRDPDPGFDVEPGALLDVHPDRWPEGQLPAGAKAAAV